MAIVYEHLLLIYSIFLCTGNIKFHQNTILLVSIDYIVLSLTLENICHQMIKHKNAALLFQKAINIIDRNLQQVLLVIYTLYVHSAVFIMYIH